MAINFNNSNGCQPASCTDKFGCGNQCPDFIIRQHDTRPEFKVSVEDCNGPLDIRGLVVEVNMWALAKLKTNITADTEYFRLAGDVGFEQIMINDIIVMDRVRLPEYMLVTGFDETNKLVRVQRGYKGTVPSAWVKGSKMRIFRILNGQGETEIVYEDIRNVDGTVDKDVITSASLLYKWQPEDTCLPGCYYLEFKLLKMIDLVLFLPGGNWTGPVYKHDDGYFYTGDSKTESSVRLSYDSVNNLYLIPTDHWTGPYHLFSGDYYTGIEQNNGSVYLDRKDHPFGVGVEQQEVPPSVEEVYVNALAIPSVVPSFTPSTQYDPPSTFDPTIYGCWLGVDVEWARRLPVDGEGFLIKITGSPTAEL